ncbi:MAG: transposase [Pirellulales bacterium]
MTFSCYRRLPLFTKQRTSQWIVEAIERSRQKNPFDLWAWVIMPEHVHIVLLPHPKVRIASILTTLKQSVARRAIHWLKENSPEFLNELRDVQPNGK